MVCPQKNQCVKRTAWSLISFLSYAYYDIQPNRKLWETVSWSSHPFPYSFPRHSLTCHQQQVVGFIILSQDSTARACHFRSVTQQPINQFKPIQQIGPQVLRAYCSNTVNSRSDFGQLSWKAFNQVIFQHHGICIGWKCFKKKNNSLFLLCLFSLDQITQNNYRNRHKIRLHVLVGWIS